MAPNISVCMAIKNGGEYLYEQVSSILPQLAGEDELVISDDHSEDDSLKIIQCINDPRIRLIQNPESGLISNFENALRSAQGTYIFLADQDDVWVPDKVATTLSYLKTYDLVVTDCMVVNENLELLKESFYHVNKSRKGIFRNFMRNSYMGCCMAFHRKILKKALPFPEKISMHDQWIGLIGEMYFSVQFIDKKLIYHRRHLHNASTSSNRSNASMVDKISDRVLILKNVIVNAYAI